jgi:thioesterase domain-containing protein
LGWSLGGYVAYEIACYLEAKGDSNTLVFLLDTFPPAYFSLEKKESSRVLLRHELRALEGVSTGNVTELD